MKRWRLIAWISLAGCTNTTEPQTDAGHGGGPGNGGATGISSCDPGCSLVCQAASGCVCECQTGTGGSS